jgi:hypothetical protein
MFDTLHDHHIVHMFVAGTKNINAFPSFVFVDGRRRTAASFHVPHELGPRVRAGASSVFV